MASLRHKATSGAPTATGGTSRRSAGRSTQRAVVDSSPRRGRDGDPILDAARACVVAVGVRRTTLTDVARRAGVSRMTVYRRVPDVDRLILEVISRDLAALLATVDEETADLPTGRARLTAAVLLVLDRLPSEPMLHRVLDVDPELLLPYLTERSGSTQRAAQEFVEQRLRDGISDGSIRDCDVATLAHCLVRIVTAFVVAARASAAEHDQARIVAELSLLLDAWLAPAPGRHQRRVGRR